MEHYFTSFSEKQRQPPREPIAAGTDSAKCDFFIMLLVIYAETLINDVLGKCPFEGHFADSGGDFSSLQAESHEDGRHSD